MTILATHSGPVGSRAWLLSHGVRILVILVVAVVISWIARLAVRRMQRRLEAATGVTKAIDLQRAATLTHTLSYVARITIWTLAVLLLLGEVDINLAPLLAGAGIAGVALGFGAQSLVKDFLSGFFILLENQYALGDAVNVWTTAGAISGTVEQMSLRTTSVRAFDGTLNVIPNGNILVAGNRSKGWGRAIVDVAVAPTEDVDRLRSALEELFGELRAEMPDEFTSGPEVLGVERLTDSEMVVRVAAEVTPARRAPLERDLRRRIKQRLDERGIRAPLPSQGRAPRPDGAPEA